MGRRHKFSWVIEKGKQQGMASQACDSGALRQEAGYESKASLPPKWGLVSSSNSDGKIIILKSSIFISVLNILS